MTNADILLAKHHIGNACRTVNLESVKDFFFQMSYLKVRLLWRSFSHSPSLSARPPGLQHPTREWSRADSGQRTSKPHKNKRKSEGWKEKSIKEKAEPWGWVGLGEKREAEGRKYFSTNRKVDMSSLKAAPMREIREWRKAAERIEKRGLLSPDRLECMRNWILCICLIS